MSEADLGPHLEAVTAKSTVAGKYRILGSLGHGGMADVYLAAAQGPAGFNKLVVVKKLREARTGDPSYVSMFLDEARLAARLNHPNVVHTYEIGEDADAYFIAMEYLEGQSLSRIAHEMRLRNDPMAPSMAAHLASEALHGLHYAHEMKDYDGTKLGIVHRDVSPQNLHVTYDGQMKVLDFGIAKAALNTSQTEAGVLKGKFAYMSPEQAVGEDVDARSDVFGMGIVLWEALTGERLFKGDNAVALAKLMTSVVRKPSELNPNVTDALDEIVLTALQRLPANRYASAQDMANALEDYVQSLGKRVRREDVARRMDALFGETREKLRRQVQKQMETLATWTGEVEPLGASGSRPSFSPTGSGVMERIVTGQYPNPMMPQPAPVPDASASPKRNKVLIIGAGIAAITVLGFGAGLLIKPSAPVASAQAAGEGVGSTKTGAQTTGATATPLPPAAQGEAESFHLTLSSDPLEAQVEWVSKPVGQTPMMIDLMAGPQTFVLSREGYFNATVVVNVTDAMAGQTQSRTVVMVPRSKGAIAAAAAPQVNVVTAPAAPSRGGSRASSAAAAPAPVAESAPNVAAAIRANPPPPPAPEAAPKPSEPAQAPAVVAVAAPAPAPQAIAAAAPVAAAEAPTPASAPKPTVAAASAPSVLPFGPEMTRPVLLSGSDPVWTREAIVAGVEGVMIAKCTVTALGTLESCRIVKGLPYMDKAMLDALATRRYSPVTYQGKAVAVEYVFNVRLAKKN